MRSVYGRVLLNLGLTSQEDARVSRETGMELGLPWPEWLAIP